MGLTVSIFAGRAGIECMVPFLSFWFSFFFEYQMAWESSEELRVVEMKGRQ